MDKLENLLKQQIAAVLSKIDENEDSGDGSSGSPMVDDYADAESGVQSSIKDETEDSMPNNQRDDSLQESLRQSSNYRQSLMKSDHNNDNEAIISDEYL